MSLRRRARNEYPTITSNYNNTSDLNPSQFVDENTDFILRPITLENIDQAVWESLNRRFTVGEKLLNLIPLDADVAAFKFQTPAQFDEQKGYLNFPYFTMWRTGVGPEASSRTSPSHKPAIYTVPKKKGQGIVYEEYIMPVPQLLRASYTFKFVTTYREHTNEFEQQMLQYFKNKRNLVVVDKERFEIMPTAAPTPSTLEVADRDGSQGYSLYILTYELAVVCYLRDINQIQKRERPNTYDIQIVERSGPSLLHTSETITRIPRPGSSDVTGNNI